MHSRAQAGADVFWAAAPTRLAGAFAGAGYFAPGTTWQLPAFDVLVGCEVLRQRAAKALCRTVLSPAPRRSGAIHR